jgi:hypothetical protein
MRTIRTKVYFFNELNKEAQSVAIEKERNNLEVFLMPFEEDAEREIEEKGFKDNIGIHYSLSYSQGDGFCFGCDNFSDEIMLKFYSEILGEGREKRAKVIMENCSFECNGNKGHYTYARKFDIDYYLNDSKDVENVQRIVLQVREKLENYYMELCKDLENQGYSEIEFQYSDEAITENLINNNCEFTKDGSAFNL